MTLTLTDITKKRRFGWFAVRQTGAQAGTCTDAFFKRNWNLPWQIGPKYPPKSQPQTIQLVNVRDAGAAMRHARQTLQQCSIEAEHGTWKIFVVAAYPYLMEGLNHAPHVRCTIEVT